MKKQMRQHAIFLARLLVLACLGARTAAAEQPANAPAQTSATNPTVPPSAELQKLLATYEVYQALSPAEKTPAARPIFAYPALSKTAAAEWRQALWQAWIERQTNTPPLPLSGLGFPNGWIKSEKVVLGCVETDYWRTPDAKITVRMRYAVLPCGEAPATGWPVYINLHGGGPNPTANDQGWAATLGQYPVPQGLLVCPRAPTDSAGSWNDPRSAVALEKLLTELRARWPVDPNRIYLMGYSMGAIGSFHLGPLMPDRWAAVAGSSGFTYLGTEGRAAPDNLRNLPVMIQNGTADLAFQRYPLAKAFAEAVLELHRADPEGYRVEFKEHPGRQHMIDDKDTPAWLSQFTRDPRPRRIVWQQPLLPVPLGTEDLPKVLEKNYDFGGFLRQRCYWLRNDAPGVFQRLVVSREGNTFRIEQACHVPKLTLLLDDTLADLNQPVVVVGGGRELARAKVPRTVTALVASLVEYGDPELMFCSEWTVPAPDSVAEMEQQTLKTAAERRARAQNRMALKRYADAAADLEAALELEPKSAPALLRALRPLYEAGKDTAHVVSTLRRLAEALPDDASVQFEAAMLLMLSEPETLRDEPAALRFAEKAMELTQNKNPQFARAMGLAYHRNGQSDQAVATVKAALALIPAGQAPNLRADLETALQTYSAGLKTTPASPDANKKNTGGK
jgi:predicted esterase